VKLTVDAQGNLEARLNPREMHHFMALVRLYPCVPPAHHKVTKGAVKKSQKQQLEGSQALLDEALAEHREEKRRALQEFLADPKRCKKRPEGGLLKLSPGDAEWLLQVLNDIRVGSWLKLGSPETCDPPITDENSEDVWALHLSGYFEGALLDGLSGS